MSRLGLGLAFAAALSAVSAAYAQGDPQAGARDFQACIACHTVEPGRHMTGPSLADMPGRKAGSLADFPRYSQPLKNSGLVWDDKTLDRWLANPQAVIPGTYMIFPGIKEARARADLIAYLKSATAEDKPAQSAQDGGMQGGMMMGRGQAPTDLKTLGPDAQLASIRYCGDTYVVTAASGKTQPIWENNLRFKTDSSDKGPRKGHPVLLPTGMMGDRASAVFADPAEISSFVERKC